MTTTPELSIVIPFFNEGPNVVSLLTEVRATVDALGVPTEVIAVDDGSRDETARNLSAVAAGWPAVHIISLERNSGQAAALLAGFAAARAPWIAMLDGDGQNPPAEIARLWEARDRAHMIVGRRIQRQDTPLRRGMSRVANTVRQWLLHDGTNDTGCSLKLFRREIVASFVPIRSLYSFLPACARWDGWSVMEIAVAHRARLAGESKYGLRVMAWRPLFDLLSLAWLLRRRLPRSMRPDSSRLRD